MTWFSDSGFRIPGLDFSFLHSAFAGVLGRGARVLWLCLTVVSPALGQVAVDTIGWTDRDRQMYGPSVRFICNDTVYGIHIVWKFGYGGIRYNFRPHYEGWRWPGGKVVNQYPRNLGCLDVDITSGKALISADYTSRCSTHISYFIEETWGSGSFSEIHVASGYQHALVAAARYGWAKFAALHGDSLCHRTTYSLEYLGRIGPFPSHSVTAAKKSSRFAYIWSATDGPDQKTLYLKETPNNGASWYATVDLSDSVPGPWVRTMLGGSAVYDSIRLHVVTALHDGGDVNSSQIWHYSKSDSPPWSLVHEVRLAPSIELGDQALAAGRPTIGRNPRSGDYFAVWEQFDPENIDPVTSLSRADIWAARSCDCGRTWGEPVRLTRPDASTKRFPFLAELVDDTLRLVCFGDQVAGFWEQGQGPQTQNPVLYVRVPSDLLPTGLAEGVTRCGFGRLSITPTVSRQAFTLSTDTPLRLVLFDQSGRKALELRTEAGTAEWGQTLRPGIYFARASPDPGAGGPAGSRCAVYRVVKLP